MLSTIQNCSSFEKETTVCWKRHPVEKLGFLSLSSLMMLDPFTNGHHISKVKVKEQREEVPILSSYWHFGVNKN
jgi:hypothetical protein